MLTPILFFPFKHSVQKNVQQRFYQALLVAFVLFFTSACASWLQPTLKQTLVEIKSGEYTLDQDHAALLFKINHMGFSSYVGRFNNFEVNLDFDPSKVENSKVEALIDMRSIDVNNPAFAVLYQSS